ncbi:MAG: hypothetical protein IT376_10795 [Polyangiaceae bacterium]|nr:hypothetical protein [Polyangiaceae bacterium]
MRYLRPHDLLNRSPWLVGLALVAVIAARGAGRVPFWSWDVLPYVAISLEGRAASPGDLHARTYSAVRADVPQRTYKDFTEGAAFRRDVARDADAFTGTLGMYRQRVGYALAIRAAGLAGAAPAEAVVWVSRVAWVLLATALYAAAARRTGPLRAAAIAALVVHAPPFVAGSTQTTPDLAAAALFAAGLSAWPAARAGGVAGLLMAVLFRPELALPAAGFVACAASATPRVAAGAAAVLLGACAAATLGSGHPGWWRLVWISFVDLRSDLQAGPFTWTAYWQIVARSATTIDASWALPSAALALTLRGAQARAAAALLLGFVARFALFPALWDRLLLPVYASLAVLALGAVREERTEAPKPQIAGSPPAPPQHPTQTAEPAAPGSRADRREHCPPDVDGGTAAGTPSARPSPLPAP